MISSCNIIDNANSADTSSNVHLSRRYFGTGEMIRDFHDDESGQGITEYGAILAFVALLIAVVFGFAQGTLQSAISQSFSTIVSQLNRLNRFTSSAT